MLIETIAAGLSMDADEEEEMESNSKISVHEETTS